MTSKIYQVSCHKCEKRFNTSFALKQHLVKSHSIRTLPKRISCVSEGIEAPLPKPQRISKRAGPYHAYKTWRESVLKGINNFNFKFNFVPAEFFRQFLADLGKPTMYSVKDTSHWRAPIFHTSTRRISFKMFQMTAIRSALLEIQKAQAWCGNRVELS